MVLPPQNGLKMVPKMVPKSTQHEVKWYPYGGPVGTGWVKRSHDGNNRLQDGHEEAPRRPEMAPGGPKMAPRWPHRAP